MHENYSLVLDGPLDTAIISLDVEGYIVHWSEGARLILGWTQEEMLGQTLDRLFTVDDLRAGQLKAEIAEAVARGQGGQEGWRVRKDGRLFWASGEINPLRGEGGTIVGFVKILRDRTNEKRTEDALREQTRALELLNRTSAAMAAEPDPARLIQLVTDAGVTLAGAEFGAFFYSVIVDQGERYMLYTLSGAPMAAFANFPMPRNTAVFAPTFAGESIVRSDDITKDPRYGKSDTHFGMPHGHLKVTSYLAVPVVSRSGEVMGGLLFGHSAAGVFDERAEQTVAGLAGEAAVAIDNARLFEAAQREIEDRKRAEEALRALNANLEREVTERTEQLLAREEALRQSQKMEAVGQLTGGIAHDFNNLLQGIMGSLDLLLELVQLGHTQDLRRFITSAMASAGRAAGLVHRLLAFSRRQPLDPKPVKANPLVASMEELLRRTLGEQIELELVLDAGLWISLCDANQLETAILNLVINARDAMPNGGNLSIETCNAQFDDAYAANQRDVQPGEYVCLSVTDTGTGMPDDVIAHAFEPFFTTKPIGQGTGLGLSMVYGFAHQSEGYVKIYSEIGMGTSVKLYLPRHYGRIEDEIPATVLTEHHRAKEGDIVLVVEDDIIVRGLIVEVLRKLGYDALEAADGPTGLETLQTRKRIDLLITDIGLPGLNGRQLADAARVSRPTLKVLFMTGYAENAALASGFLESGMAMITKPFPMEAMAKRIRYMMERP